ncbi:MAG: hypothetical protein WC485_04250, partial [Opitutaceae bacterium]
MAEDAATYLVACRFPLIQRLQKSLIRANRLVRRVRRLLAPSAPTIVMNPFRLAAALLLSCFGVFLPSLLPARPKWDPVSAAELAESKPQLESGAAAEILDYRIEIDDTDRGCRIRSCQRIKIYDPARAVEATRFSRLSVGEDSPQHKLIVRLTLPDGSSQEFGKEQLLQRNLLEVGHPAGFLGWITSRDFWNLQEKFLAIPGIVPGAILD